MILRRYPTLGLLPEMIVFAFLAGLVITLSYTIWKVACRTPVLLVANAEGVSRLGPAVADEAYMRSFAENFLEHWATWNHYNFQFRRSLAISMMTPLVRSQFSALSKRDSALVDSLQQSQSLALEDIRVHALDARRGYYQVNVTGTTQVFYGGVGGDADPYRGSLLLHAITPTSTNPLCLEVLGFRVDRISDVTASAGTAAPSAAPSASSSASSSAAADAVAVGSSGKAPP